MAGEPAAGARGLGVANFSRSARISICPKTYGYASYQVGYITYYHYVYTFMKLLMQYLDVMLVTISLNVILLLTIF